MTQYVTKQELDNALEKNKKEIISTIQESIQEVLEAMQIYATHVDERFGKIDKKFDKMDERFESIETRLTQIETTMVTKDYLEQKLIDLGGYLAGAIHAVDKKITLSTQFLYKKEIFNSEEAQQILTIETFPQQNQ